MRRQCSQVFFEWSLFFSFGYTTLDLQARENWTDCRATMLMLRFLDVSRKFLGRKLQRCQEIGATFMFFFGTFGSVFQWRAPAQVWTLLAQPGERHPGRLFHPGHAGSDQGCHQATRDSHEIYAEIDGSLLFCAQLATSKLICLYTFLIFFTINL